MARLKVRLRDEEDYRGDDFLAARLEERRGFAPGAEVEVEFTGGNPHEAFGMARRAGIIYAGILTIGGRLDTYPFVSDLGPYSGRVVGSRTGDGLRGWRIDWDSKGTKGFHINWWDRHFDPARRDRSRWFYGANLIVGGSQAQFWELESHFPGAV